MVTVVSRQPHQSVVKEIVCKSCGCTLQYVPRDVKERIEHDYGGGSERIRYIECPECVEQVTVKGW